MTKEVLNVIPIRSSSVLRPDFTLVLHRKRDHYNALVPVKPFVPLVPVYAAASMSKERGLLDRHYVHADVSSPLSRSVVHKVTSQDDLTLPTSNVQDVIPVCISERIDDRKHFSCTRLRCLSHIETFTNMDR